MGRVARVRELVFDSEDLQVVKVPGHRDDLVFITFEHCLPERERGRPGFAENFLQRRGFTAYHFQPSSNSWYQLPEMTEAMARVRAEIAPGTRVVTYGMSMGAYAAYRFSEPLGADSVIAFSPQCSVDPRIVWWERRWRYEGKCLIWDRNRPRPGASIYVFYDPLNADRRHIRRILREAPMRLVRINFSGHEAITYLNECGLLGHAILGAARDDIDIPTFEALAWRERDRSPTFHKMRRRKKTGVFRRFRYFCIELMLKRRLAARPITAVWSAESDGAAP